MTKALDRPGDASDQIRVNPQLSLSKTDVISVGRMAGFRRVFCRASFRSNGREHASVHSGTSRPDNEAWSKLIRPERGKTAALSVGRKQGRSWALSSIRRFVVCGGFAVMLGLPRHPLLRPTDQPTRANNPYSRLARCRSSRSTPSRPPPRSPKSCNRQGIPAPAAAAACASSRPSCRGNSPSTARRTSGEDPNRHLMITISEPSPREAVPLSARSSTGHGSARCDAGFTMQHPKPVFADTRCDSRLFRKRVKLV
jgi:hypothetical protein